MEIDHNMIKLEDLYKTWGTWKDCRNFAAMDEPMCTPNQLFDLLDQAQAQVIAQVMAVVDNRINHYQRLKERAIRLDTVQRFTIEKHTIEILKAKIEAALEKKFIP
jgi:hypothetical protein